MGHVSTRFRVAAPIEHVWEIAADCARLQEWNVSFVEVRDCPGRIDEVGARYTAVTRVVGRRLEGQWETTHVERPHRVETRGTASGGHAKVSTTMSPDGDGTELSVELDYELPGGVFSGMLEKLAHKAIERDLRHSNENFAALCEATPPSRT
jgi:carbon monoxide dehydrogenase subunit G